MTDLRYVVFGLRLASQIALPELAETSGFDAAAADIGRNLLDPDQLTTEFFEAIVIESEAELDTAIGDAALGDEAPDDLLQDLLKVHASAPVAAASPLLPDRRSSA